MFSIVSTIFLVIFIPLFLVGPIILQVFLSKRDNKFVGLIIPIIQFVFSLLIVLIFSLNAVAFTNYVVDEDISTSYSEVYDDYDEFNEYDDADVDEALDYGDAQTGSSTEISVLPSIIILFFLTNIPTTISLIIYFVNRKGKPKKKQLDKINIQDLG